MFSLSLSHQRTCDSHKRSFVPSHYSMLILCPQNDFNPINREGEPVLGRSHLLSHFIQSLHILLTRILLLCFWFPVRLVSENIPKPFLKLLSWMWQIADRFAFLPAMSKVLQYSPYIKRFLKKKPPIGDYQSGATMQWLMIYRKLSKRRLSCWIFRKYSSRLIMFLYAIDEIPGYRVS